jgi:hypothetical protein
MRTKRMVAAVLGIALCATAPGIAAEELVARFSGESSGNTAEFTVQAPWIMDWLVSGEAAQYEVINVALVNAVTGAYEGVALKRLFDMGGRYYFRVDTSMMNWDIKVIQLSRKEAEQYQPKAGKSAPGG